MEAIASRTGHDFNLASRKAQEAAWRRYQATEWLESFVGSLGISKQPSEKEFISCLRNGLILCNAINKIQPGSVPKVVEITRFHSQSHTWDSQPLPAYQFFENVRNFLKAVEGLNLPVFEASVFERDNMEAGSSTKIVDCVLALRDYTERKSGASKRTTRSPLLHSNGRIPRSGSNLDTNRQLDLSSIQEKQSPSQNDAQKLEGNFDIDSIVKALADFMIDAKENLDGNLLSSLRNGNMDSIKSFSRILSSTLEEQLQFKSNPNMKEISGSFMSLETSSPSFKTGSGKRNCSHLQVFRAQENKLQKLKSLFSSTKAEFENLQLQLQSDLKQMESQVEVLSMAANGYHKVVKENRTLYNMVQDLSTLYYICNLFFADFGWPFNFIIILSPDISVHQVLDEMPIPF